jgi:hypothetical protein
MEKRKDCTKYYVLSTRYNVRSTRYEVQSRKYEVPTETNVEYQTPNIELRRRKTYDYLNAYFVLSTILKSILCSLYLVLGTILEAYLVLRTWYLVQ